MAAKRRSASGGATWGFGALFLLLLVVGLIVKFIWWIVGAAALVGLFFAGRALVRYVGERRAAAARAAEELAYRADRENRWARRGDTRGVYGVTGAELMHEIAPAIPDLPADAPHHDVKLAALAKTGNELKTLLADKPPGWRWAAFTSVLVQRLAEVQPRVRDCRLGYGTANGLSAHTGGEIARFVTANMNELGKLVEQVEAFILTPAFMEVFGRRSDETTADADGIVQVANRLMDYHERFLGLAERTRDIDAPSTYSGLIRDARQLMDIPLEGYNTFISDLVEFVAEMPDLMRYGRGPIEAEPISLHMSVDDQLMKRITKQIRSAARS